VDRARLQVLTAESGPTGKIMTWKTNVIAPLVVSVLASACAAHAAPDVRPAPATGWALSLKPVYASDEPPAPATAAAPGGGDSQQLAKQLQNPVADLISVPFQFNYEAEAGDGEGYRAYVNIQPVIPISLNEDWNVISRTILPVTYQEDVFPGSGSQFGLGDVLQSFFLSPVESEVIWGVGPVLLLPTATDDPLGAEKWGAGPTGLVLKQDGPWTYGVLGNHIWSFAGDGDRESVNLSFLQPFVAYTTKTATTFGLNAETTYDWDEAQWTVPLQLSVSQLMKLGNQPVQFALAGRYWAEGPDTAPEWGVRFTVTFLFPK
jgi:hypothetical protein